MTAQARRQPNAEDVVEPRCSCGRDLTDLALAVVLGAVVVAVWVYCLPLIVAWAVSR